MKELIYYIKFGNPEAFEAWAYDSEGFGFYHLEDASAEPYHFSDPRWYPRFMRIGEAHCWESDEHEIVYTKRYACNVWRRDPVVRRMWLEAVYDSFYWGPDLGERPTIVVAYDPSASQVIDGVRVGVEGRNIELGYYAHGAGSVRWDSYPSQKVYSGGDGVARFHEADIEMRSDFYLLGGPALQPKLTGCVAQVVPSYPPLPDPEPIPPDPTPPDPTPEEDNVIAYSTPVPGFQAGEEHDNGNGTISVKKANGKWLCVTPEGQVEERDAPGGPWESFKRSSNGASLIAERDSDRVYVLPRADY